MSIVIVSLYGGLGNQMFQYAAGRALALRRRAVLKLDLSDLARSRKRQFALDVLAIAAEPAGPEELAWLGMKQEDPPNPLIYDEPHFHFAPAVLDLEAPVGLRGYWQSEKYFQDCAPLLRRELSVRIPLAGENQSLAAEITSRQAVSLHVRRGDYVSEKHTKLYHGLCSLSYYHTAVKFISRQLANPHFYVFSDDPAWTRAHLRIKHPVTWVIANGPDDGFRDMQLMSLCRHHIIANSTFSWWGAWLNPSPNKLVLAPRRWFAAARHDIRDLLPKSWIRLG